MSTTRLVRHGRSTPVQRGPPEPPFPPSPHPFPPAPPFPPATRRALTRSANGVCWGQGCLTHAVALWKWGLFSSQRFVCPRTMTTRSAEGVAP
jgi:hypothetical protein